MLCGTLLVACLVLPAQEPLQIEYLSLVDGLIDLRWMCEVPRPGEGCDALAEASAGGPVELIHTRGPGVVGRIWCSRADGVLAVTVDGAMEPAVTWDLAAFAARDLASPLPPDPLAGPLGTGWYSMIPLTFQREVRIAWRPAAAGGPVQLQVDVRRLGESVAVASTTAALLEASGSDFDRVARTITDDLNPETAFGNNVTRGRAYHKMKVSPTSPYYDGTFYFPVKGSGIIRWFELSLPSVTDAQAMEIEMRQFQVRIESGTSLDSDRGNVLLEMPLGELFGSGIGKNPYDHYLMGVRADGRFIWRLPIPFTDGMKICFTHPKQKGADFLMRIASDPLPAEDTPPLRLHGGWLLGDATDAAALDLDGPVRLFSYVWSSQSATEAPWQLAAPFAFADTCTRARSNAWTQVTRRDGPGRFGRSTMLRIFGQDAPVAAAGARLQFAPAARFSGSRGEATISARALWYGPERQEKNFGATYSPEQRRPVQVSAPPCFHVAGATEAESATVISLAAGATLTVEDWSSQVKGVSRKELLLLRPSAADQQVQLGFTPAIGGEYELVARLGSGPGLGIAQMFLEGKRAGEAVDTAADIAGLSEEIVLQRGPFLPRSYTFGLRSTNGRPLALDYLRLRPVAQ
jgi:hypothetical protein